MNQLIVTIRRPGRGLAQGEAILDPRGVVPTDMHGRVTIRDGDTVLTGKPVARITKNEGQT